MNAQQLAQFTRDAAAMTARNDRRTHLRALRARFAQSALRVGIAWSALATAAVVLWLLPVNMRVA